MEISFLFTFCSLSSCILSLFVNWLRTQSRGVLHLQGRAKLKKTLLTRISLFMVNVYLSRLGHETELQGYRI